MLRQRIAFLAICLMVFLPVKGEGFSVADSMAVEALIDSARTYKNTDPDRAMAFASDAEAMARKTGYTLGVLRANNQKGGILSDSGEWVESEKYYQKCLRLADSMGRDMAVAVFLDNLGSTNRLLGNYPDAIVYHERALFIFDTLGNEEGISVCLNNMAIINKYMGERELAMEQYREAGRIAAKSGSEFRMSTFYSNVGILHMDIGNLDSAEYYQRKVLDIAERNGLKMREATGLSLLGSVLNRQDKPREALETFRKSSEIASALNNRFLLASNYVKEGNSYLILNQPRRAKERLKAAISLSDEIGSIEIRKSSILLLHRVEALLGNHEEALRLYKQGAAIGDSLTGASTKEKVARIREQYNAERKERELAQVSLELEREVRERQAGELELAETRSRIWLLVAVAALLALVAVFALGRYFNNRRYTRMLQEKQALTAKALAEKEVLIGEVHHRVKNNLQVIYNMLDMQSRSLEDQQAKAVLAESMNRVSSMALIHRELYRDGNVEGVQMRDYLARLAEHLRDSFGVGSEQVKMRMEVEAMLLDLDSSIPMGMLINELVTNAFKHAFPEGRSGEIGVELRETGGELVLEVADDGVGGVAEKGGGSFGKRLVRSLARQLRAEIVERSGPGTTTILKITKYKRLDHAED